MVQVIVTFKGNNPIVDSAIQEIGKAFNAKLIDTEYEFGVTDMEFVFKDSSRWGDPVASSNGFVQACNFLPDVDASVESSDIY